MNRLRYAAVRLCALFALLAIPAFSSAQSTNVTASSLKMGGTAIAGGTVTITPTDCGGNPIPFSGGDGSLNSPQPFSAVVTNGVLASGFSVPDQALVTALSANQSVCYAVNVSNTATKQSYSFILPYGTLTGSSFDLGSYRPTQIAAALAGSGVGTSLPYSGQCTGAAHFVLYSGTSITGVYDCINGTLRKEPVGSGSGTAPTITIGSVTQGTAAATLTGSNGAYVLNLTLPQGVAGTAGTNGTNGTTPAFTIGTVTTGAAGSQATVTITGTTPNPVLNFSIPQGATGAGSSSTIALKVNGTANGSQSTLNLKAGSNVTVTDDGSGGITIASSGTGTSTAGNLIDVTAAPYYASPYGDTRTSTSAAVTSGSTSIPVASCTNYSANNGVLITGGGTTGWTGTDYIGKVVSCTGTTMIVSPATTAAVANGAVVKHDDSAALNAVSVACKSTDCNVFYPTMAGSRRGLYLVNGPILDTAQSNAMILLPQLALVGGDGQAFRMFGPSRPVSTQNGITIQTDYALSTAVNIFGCKSNGAAYGGFCNVYWAVDNLRFYSSSSAATGHTMLDATWAKGFTTGGSVWVLASAGGWGIKYPTISNDVDISSNSVTVLGYTNGVRLGEHATIQSMRTPNATCGATFDSVTSNSGVTGHANTVTVSNLWAQLDGSLVCGGSTPQNIYVATADAEVVQNICTDSNNVLTGDIFYHVPYNDGRTSQTITGAPNKVGCNNVRLHNLDTGNCYGLNCPGSAAAVASTTRTANLVYSWPMNEGTGTTSADSVSSNTMTLTGASWTSDSTLGNVPTFSNAASSGGVTANNTNANFTNTSTFSLSAWVKPTSVSTGQTQEIFSDLINGSPYTGYALNISGSQLQIQLLSSTTSSNMLICATAQNTLLSGALHQVGVSYAGSQQTSGVNLYIDGQLMSMTCTANSLSGSFASANNYLNIGNSNSSGNNMAGVIARARIYNAVLSASDFATIYANKN